ncbi:MAG: hypothetical protein H0W08_26490 [Acidobacteria bacterium]|nr:hypothetical protein [Acidobacteriota bacterium]
MSARILKEFTFFDRHQKSQNLPSTHMVEALLKIMKETQGERVDHPSVPITALIGHSFGGAVLESALTQSLVGLVVNKAPDAEVRWPASLIMFRNEAQEARGRIS